MNIEIAMSVSGFLFLFILVTLVVSVALIKLGASVAFGNKISDFDLDDKLHKINNGPKQFKIFIVVELIEAVRVIALAIMLFIVFSPYNLILGIVWTTARLGESLTLIYDEKNHWGLLNIARQYSGTSGAEKNSLSDLGRTKLEIKNYRFNLAMTLWGIGMLAYSILFVTYGVVPSFIGWLGIVAGILLFFDHGIKLVKPNFKGISGIGALLGILFEVIIGGWLLFFSH